MRKNMILTAFLAAVLMGLMIFSVHLLGKQDTSQENLQIQYQQLESKTKTLEEKEKELAQLQGKQKTEEVDSEWLRLQEEATLLEDQKAALQEQILQLETDINALLLKLRSEESEQSYYLEVYDALTEGLNKVQGYISGN